MLVLGCVLAFEAVGAASAPPAQNSDKRWRIAYYQGGDYHEYHDSLVALLEQLMERGWLVRRQIPVQYDKRTRPLWDWLARVGRSAHLEFAADGYYTAEWDEDSRAEVSERLLERLESGAFDLVLAFGTWAGKDLANDRHAVPTLVISTSDALAAGIVIGTEDSGFDHVHAHLDPTLFERQVRAFHDAVGFDRLGVAFENTVNGRSYAGLGAIGRVAEERGFEVVACHTLSDTADTAAAERTVLDCFKRLGREVDALYITEQGGVTERTLPSIVHYANAHRAATFSQRGTADVRQGVLMSLSGSPARQALAGFHADTFGQVLLGARPGDLPLVFHTPLNVALNLETARSIGFLPQASLMAAADELYGRPVTGDW